MLASSATFADQPGFVPGHMLATHVANALWRPVSDPHAHGGKACRQPTFRAAAPADRAPGCDLPRRRAARGRRGRPAGPARPAAPPARRRGPVRPPEAACPARGCRGRSASSPARAARRATTCSRGCAAAAGRGGSCGPSRRCRTGTPRRAIARRCATSSATRRARRDRRRPRRRLAGRPVRLLRRVAVPHRRAPARPGDRLGRPSHRPHADRRRRRRLVLDADPRRRDGRRPRRRAPPAPSCAAAPSACAATVAAPCSTAPASSSRLSRAPEEHVARHRRRLHQQLRELRRQRAAPRRRRARQVTARGARCVIDRKATLAAGADAARAPPRRSTRARARPGRPRSASARWPAATRWSRTATASRS